MLSAFLLSQDFVNSKANVSLFVLHTPKDMTLVLVYVNDIITLGSNSQFIQEFITTLSSQFATKDLGPLHYFLGIKVTYSSSGLFFSSK